MTFLRRGQIELQSTKRPSNNGSTPKKVNNKKYHISDNVKTDHYRPLFYRTEFAIDFALYEFVLYRPDSFAFELVALACLFRSTASSPTFFKHLF